MLSTVKGALQCGVLCTMVERLLRVSHSAHEEWTTVAQTGERCKPTVAHGDGTAWSGTRFFGLRAGADRREDSEGERARAMSWPSGFGLLARADNGRRARDPWSRGPAP
jgi:hypothetical protein